MPAVSQEADDPSEDWTMQRALALLEQALVIIDRWDASPAVGARLQQVIEDVQELSAQVDG
ncbi:hypothetical protein GCM10023264_11580 [Sphingomonas daechungensis]|uniref:Uncharacterized protein n=1 Tax=Sphingomonas daechungensis TaxID=1176646 RepID=A0ABX6SYM2_9SPHN|nr:hypothetical protein [Sphingomonas daechungensis]QNP42406.1 hypothetical protein H9L15_08765 [Sphingomonas daechungensis]